MDTKKMRQGHLASVEARGSQITSDKLDVTIVGKLFSL
jgi:hypothetical protein